jgi:hypothetical protein
MRPGVHLLLVEPRVLSGWAVASQHESCAGAAKTPCSTATMGRFGTEVLQASVDREPPPLGTRREGGGVSLQPPRLLLDYLRRPDQIGFCQGPGAGWQALSTASVWVRRVPTSWRRGRWMEV